MVLQDKNTKDTMEKNMSFGEKIKQLRREKGWSQSKLAEKTEVARIMIGYYERGQHLPHKYNVYKLAAALEVDSSELFQYYKRASE